MTGVQAVCSYCCCCDELCHGDLPFLEEHLLVGTKHTRQQQVDTLRNVLQREHERLQMAQVCAQLFEEVFGPKSEMARAAYFHTRSAKLDHLYDRLLILCWTCSVLRDLDCDEFFLGDDYNSKGQTWLHSGKKQNLLCRAVSHEVLDKLLQERLDEDALTHGDIVVKVGSEDLGAFRSEDPGGKELWLDQTSLLHIKLLDFTASDWTVVDRVYVKGDLMTKACKNAATRQVNVPRLFRQAMQWYMRHFRDIEGSQDHEIFIWVVPGGYRK